MKVYTEDGRAAEAGAYVIMKRTHSGIFPVTAHTSLEGVNAHIVRLYEDDAAMAMHGGVPGVTHFYYVPVEVQP